MSAPLQSPYSFDCESDCESSTTGQNFFATLGRRGVIVLAIIFNSVASIASIASAATGPLSWQDLLQRAASDSQEIKSGELQVRAQDYDRKRAWGGLLPDVNLTAQKYQQNQDPLGTDQETRATTYGGEVRWSLFSGFSTLADIQKSTAELGKSRAEFA
jgi:outer membrane protein TolC